MSSSATQLLDPRFERLVQQTLWDDSPPPLRYVIKRHHATKLHYDFRLELYGKLFSLALDELPTREGRPVCAKRVEDHDLKYRLGERLIPVEKKGSGPMLVWDHGIYRTPSGRTEDIYQQLAGGRLVIQLQGVRLQGQLELTGQGENWRLNYLTPFLRGNDERSVLTGRSLPEIEHPLAPYQGPFRLWLEWEQYYTENTLGPEVAVKDGEVVDMNFAARCAGITVGMRLQHVLPLVPGCAVKPWRSEPGRAKAWLKRLVPYSNVIEPLDEHCAVVDLSAHPDPCDIARRIVDKLTDKPFGYLRYGVGNSKWLAQLAARRNEPYGFLRNPAFALGPLSVDDLLVASPEDRERLKALGLTNIADVAWIAPSTLRAQFGDNALLLASAAEGRTRDRVLPLYPPSTVAISHFFDDPVDDSQVLEKVIDELAKQLTQKLEGRQANLVGLTLELEEGAEKTQNRKFSRPVHSYARIQVFLRHLGLELMREGAKVARITAKLDQLEPLQATQQSLFIARSASTPDHAAAALQATFGQNALVLGKHVKVPRRNLVLKAWRNATGWD